jgi:hypothetical protein
MHRFARKLLTTAATAALVLTGAAFAAGPAAATDCAVGRTCLWADPNYATSGHTLWSISFEQYIPDLRLHHFPGTGQNGNDSVTSVSNQGRLETVLLYQDLHCSGYSFVLAKGTGDGNLSDSAGHAPGGYDDFLTSARFASFRAACGGN